MSTLISYDVTKEKQTEFKKWLIQNKGWEERFSNKSLPDSTLIKKSTSNGSTDVTSAINDLKEAEVAVDTKVSSAIIASTLGTIDHYHSQRFSMLR